MDKPTVDVAIISAHYNNAEFLPQYFESILTSSYLPKEIIIVDDGSTDNSKEILSKYASVKGITILHTENRGVSEATNDAIRLSSAAYLLILDTDDYLHPERIKLQFEFLNSNPNIDILGGQCVYFDHKTNKQISQSNFPLSEKDISNKFRNAENGVLNGTVMGKRYWFEEFPVRKKMEWAQDYDAYVRMFAAGASFSALKEVVTFVRLHQNSATTNITFDTVHKLYIARLEALKIPYEKVKAKRYFYHLYYWRKYLSTRGGVKKWFSLGLSMLCMPEKVFKRIF